MSGLIYKGLDWLPPGEVSFADYARAMLAADAYYWPRLTSQRRWLLAECRRRQILDRVGEPLQRVPRRLRLSAREFASLQRSRATQRRFVEAHRRLLGLPSGSPFTVDAHVGAARLADLSRHTSSESAELGEPRRRPPPNRDPLLVLKVAFAASEPNDLGTAFGRRRTFRMGTTLTIDGAGFVHGLLRGGRDGAQRHGRSGFLRRLAAAGALARPGQTLGPDGARLQSYVLSRRRSGGLALSGSFRALHLVAGEP
jgi:hypothetical protein